MQKTFYTTSRTAWDAMLQTMQHAKKSIFLEMYIFEQDATDHDFMAVLMERARAGLQVIVVLDAWGSFWLAKEVRQQLMDAGVELMFYSYWFHRTHRKLLVVDEAVAYVGGVNVGARFVKWDDLVMRVEGRVVRSVVRSFARAYRACGGADARLTAYAHRRPVVRARTWFFEHGLLGKRYTLRRYYTQHIDRAKTSVTLVTPYFLPARWLIAALGRACKRGVVVEILVPERPVDHTFFSWIHTHFAAMLTQLGARIYLLPTMNHAKAMVVDNHIGLVGSQNLDSLSFVRNAEAGIFFENTPHVQALRKVVDEWKTQAKQYDASQYVYHWYDRLLALLLRVVQPVL